KPHQRSQQREEFGGRSAGAEAARRGRRDREGVLGDQELTAPSSGEGRGRRVPPLATMRPRQGTAFHTKGKEAGRPGAGLAAPPAGSGLIGSIGYRVRATPV